MRDYPTLKRSNSALPEPAYARVLDYNRLYNYPNHVQTRKDIGYKPTTNYQAEFVARSPARVQSFRPLDNLRTGTGPMEKTVYQKEFIPRASPQQLQATRQYKDVHKNVFEYHNNRSHVKDIIHNQDLERSKSPIDRYEERLKDAVEKPGKFIKPKDVRPHQYSIQKDTEYTKNFKQVRPDRSLDAKFNYDNLHVYPNLAYNPTTAYADNHFGHRQDTSPNKTLYELNKQTNQFTHPIQYDNDWRIQTEYKKNYHRFANDQDNHQFRQIHQLPAELRR
jgi:hypothetical protein